MTVKSHRIHEKRVSREMVIESHPVGWTTEGSLMTYWSAGSVEGTGRDPDLKEMESVSSETSCEARLWFLFRSLFICSKSYSDNYQMIRS